MKKFLTIILCLISLSCFMFGQTTEETLRENVGLVINPIVDVFDTYSMSNIAQHNVYDDAYIGKLFPSPIPHFGIGITTSAIIIPKENVPEEFSIAPILPLPSASGNIRIGGIFLPMDFGFNYMLLNEKTILDKFSVSYKTIGFDARMALLKQGFLKPNISIGTAYSLTDGSVATGIYGGNAKINFNSEVATATLQVSKDVLIFTPFVGARYSTSKENYSWNANVDVEGTKYSVEELREYDYFRKNNFQIFGGLGIKILILHTTFGATYDITNSTYGGNLSIKVAL